MAMTREASKEAYKHVLLVVLGLTMGDDLFKALTNYGCLAIEDLMSMRSEDIDTLRIDENNELPRAQKALVRIFLLFVDHKLLPGGPVTDWKAITADAFNEFRISPECRAAMRRHPSVPTHTSATTPGTRNPVSDF